MPIHNLTLPLKRIPKWLVDKWYLEAQALESAQRIFGGEAGDSDEERHLEAEGDKLWHLQERFCDEVSGSSGADGIEDAYAALIVQLRENNEAADERGYADDERLTRADYGLTGSAA